MAEFETAQRLRSLWITFPLKLRALRARLQGLLVRVRTRPVGVIRCVVGKGLQAGVLEDGVVHYPDFAGVVHLDGRGRKAAAQRESTPVLGFVGLGRQQIEPYTVGVASSVSHNPPRPSPRCSRRVIGRSVR